MRRNVIFGVKLKCRRIYELKQKYKYRYPNNKYLIDNVKIVFLHIKSIIKLEISLFVLLDKPAGTYEKRTFCVFVYISLVFSDVCYLNYFSLSL